MNHLPPGGWADVATRPQLEALEQRVAGLEGAVRSVDDRLAAVEARLGRQLRAHIATTIAAVLATAAVVLAATGLG